MIWWALAGLCLLAMFRNVRCGVVMLFCVTLTAFVSDKALPFEVVLFSAIYTGIGAMTFFLFEAITGAFLCAIGLIFALQGFGYVSEYIRQIVGECLFVIGLLAGAIFGPSGGISSRTSLLGFRLGNRADYGDTAVDQEGVAPQELRQRDEQA